METSNTKSFFVTGMIKSIFFFLLNLFFLIVIYQKLTICHRYDQEYWTKHDISGFRPGQIVKIIYRNYYTFNRNRSWILSMKYYPSLEEDHELIVA
jgi:hypothetical protein